MGDGAAARGDRAEDRSRRCRKLARESQPYGAARNTSAPRRQNLDLWRPRRSPRPRPGPASRAPARRAGCRLGACRASRCCASRRWLGFLVYPTYPELRLGYYGLIWGRELLGRRSAVVRRLPRADRASAGVRHGALLSLLGATAAERALVASALISFLLPAGRRRSTASAGWRSRRRSGRPPSRCSSRASTSRSWPLRGYIDIPYLALVVWAAALETERPRRGGAVWVLLDARRAAAPRGVAARRRRTGSGCSARHSWPGRVRLAALTAVGPVVVGATDLAVTGDPLFSLHSHEPVWPRSWAATSRLLVGALFADLLLVKVVKRPVRSARCGGFAAALCSSRAVRHAHRAADLRRAHVRVRRRRRPLGDPALPGDSQVMLLVFGAVAIAGWSMLTPGRLRTAWMVAAGLACAGGAAYTARQRQPREARRRARVARRRARVAAARAGRSRGRGGAALRPGVGHQPQARP